MLTPDYLEQVTRPIVNIYSELEERLIEDIARRIVGAGTMTESARWQIQLAQQSGMLYDEVIEAIAENVGIREQEVRKIFEEASIESLKFDDDVYKKAGLNPIPLKQNKTMLNILASTLSKTNMELSNLTLTTANSAQETFLDACNKAYMDVVTRWFRLQYSHI